MGTSARTEGLPTGPGPAKLQVGLKAVAGMLGSLAVNSWSAKMKFVCKDFLISARGSALGSRCLDPGYGRTSRNHSAFPHGPSTVSLQNHAHRSRLELLELLPDQGHGQAAQRWDRSPLIQAPLYLPRCILSISLSLSLFKLS